MCRRRRGPGLLFALAVAAAASLVVVTVGPTSPAAAWSRGPVRLSGSDRYDTAARLSRSVFATGAASAVVVSGEAFPDGLSAGPLAALFDAPVLLTQRHGLPAPTAAELDRLGPQRVFVVGGPSAVSDATLAQIAQSTGVTPHRVAGADRYATASAVASLFQVTPSAVYVASGAAFPDALAGAAAAARATVPLLLVRPGSVPASVAGQLTRLRPPVVFVLGGPAAVSHEVVTALGRQAASVRRLAGADRYGTAAAVAADRAPGATEALLATGAGFADALAAAPLARRRNAPVLLTRPECAPPATIDVLRAGSWPALTVVGGTSAVSSRALTVQPCASRGDGQVTPGVWLSTYVLPGPRVARVLTIDRRQGMEIRATTATGELSGRLRTADIARRWDAVAAVNGDFFLSDGQPVHPLASLGRLLKGPAATATVVGFAPDRPADALFARPALAMSADVASSGTSIAVHRVNDSAPTPAEVALYTPEGAPTVDIHGPWCKAELQPQSGPNLDAGGDAVQAHTVVSASCGDGVVTVGSNDVLMARTGTTGATDLAALTAGELVNLRWRAHPGAAGVLDLIGANLTLVHGGVVSTDVTLNSGAFFTERAPRTAVGMLPDGRVVLVVVDGRQSGYSIGMTPRELADFMVTLGVIDAANLDGGGSTAMAVDGVVVNRPSEATGERSVGSALVIVPTGAGVPAVAAAEAANAKVFVAGFDALLDPASLGGWLAHLELQEAKSPAD